LAPDGTGFVGVPRAMRKEVESQGRLFTFATIIRQMLDNMARVQRGLPPIGLVDPVTGY
jgi:hypothetical protein